MTCAYVGLGSNIEPEANVRAAVRLLAARERVVAASTFYRTESIPPGAPAFVDGVLAIETARSPVALREVLREVEARLGRVRTADKNAPRTIDCDLLLHGDAVVPSSDIETRAFVAIALLEVAPDLVLPGSGRRLAEVVAAAVRHEMAPLPDLTETIRRDLRDAEEEVDDGPNTHRGAGPAAPR
jgi:dihydroneopterin aldolase/2-amino-4-hydroxy-6-hydroxymethyldihydropteridine diphosphokinase